MGRVFLVILCGFSLLGVGCQNTKTRAVEGAVIGGLLGGAAGGIIGHQSGHGGEGAGIGVAAGAITGALVGSQIDKPQKQQVEQSEPQAVEESSETKQLSMQQIINMSKQGLKDDEIIKEIRATNSKFNLSEEGINYLKNEGVSQNVISVMQSK